MRIVELLGWKLKTIEKIIPNIESQGFDTIQISPVQPIKRENGFNWKLYYQPLDFSIGNQLGNKTDLINLSSKAKKYNISIAADIVCLHVVNKSGEEAMVPHNDVAKRLQKAEFYKPRVPIKDYENRYDATHGVMNLPGLDLTNSKLQNIIFRFLKELKKCGVDGFRIDAAKHIGLPNDGIDFIAKLSTLLKENDLFAYGELINGTQEWRDELALYLDVLTHYSSPLTDNSKHVAFLENHDTFLHNETKYIDTWKLISYYELLTYKFEKTCFYPRPIHWPYDENMDRINDFGIPFYKINELDYFDTSFLYDKRIREANHIKVLKK